MLACGLSKSERIAARFQVVEAFAEREAPRYLIRDRDASYGNEFRRRIQSLRGEGGDHRTSKSVAERLCRAADWLDST